jgi:hypothetical protein
MIGIMGKRAIDGFANRPYSNVGVQYGLTALNSGSITPAQFVDLNSKLGSHDIDDAFQGFRTAADAPAIAESYRSGWINSGNGLSRVAILDVRSPDTSTIHHQIRSWVVRARLDNAQGQHRNQVIWFDSTRTAECEAMAPGIGGGAASLPPARSCWTSGRGDLHELRTFFMDELLGLTR